MVYTDIFLYLDISYIADYSLEMIWILLKIKFFMQDIVTFIGHDLLLREDFLFFKS